MKRIFKVLGLIVAAIIVVAGASLGVIYARTESKRDSKIDVAVDTFSIPTDEASITEGKRLVQVKACADCHDTDLGGKTFIDVPPLGRFSGSNLTSGKGSGVVGFTDEDWIRAIRFGVGNDGHPLIAMPAGDFHGMSNEDLGRMIAYLKTVPPVDRESQPQSVGPVARVMYSAGQLPLLFPFEEVSLTDKPVDKVEVGATVEYGKYLSMACTGCHGNGFSGGHVPGTPPEWPSAANLTASGRTAGWSLAEFKTALTTGQTPDGHQIDPQFMPWKSFAAMTDTEIEALYLFVKQLPAKAAGTR